MMECSMTEWCHISGIISTVLASFANECAKECALSEHENPDVADSQTTHLFEQDQKKDILSEVFTQSKNKTLTINTESSEEEDIIEVTPIVTPIVTPVITPVKTPVITPVGEPKETHSYPNFDKSLTQPQIDHLLKVLHGWYNRLRQKYSALAVNVRLLAGIVVFIRIRCFFYSF